MLAAAKDFAPSRAACHNWDRKDPARLSDCIMGEGERPQFDFALWGDSHAAAVAGAVDALGRDIGRKGLQLTSDNCLPLLGTQVFHNGAMTDCEARNEAALGLLRRHRVRRVLLIGAWVQYLGDYDKVLRLSDAPSTPVDDAPALRRALLQTIGRLRAAGIQAVIVGPVPYVGWNVASVLAASQWRGRALPDGPLLAAFMASERKVMPALEQLEADGVAVVYPHQRLCKATCIVHLDGQPLYSDGEHLTGPGADLLRPMFAHHLSRAPTVP
jgi:hypothetical protein